MFVAAESTAPYLTRTLEQLTQACASHQASIPAVGNFWGSTLEPQSIRERHFSTQKPFLLWFVAVHKKAIDIVLPVANRLATIRIRPVR